MNNNIVNLVRNTVKGTTFVSFKSVTVPKMRKTNNPFFGLVEKHSQIHAQIGFDYNNAVNNLATKEGKMDREAKPRKWGTVTEDKLFVEHKGTFYLRARVLSTKSPVYINKETGEPFSEKELEEIKTFLPKSRKSSTQSDLEGEVIERDYKVESLKELKFKGVTVS